MNIIDEDKYYHDEFEEKISLQRREANEFYEDTKKFLQWVKNVHQISPPMNIVNEAVRLSNKYIKSEV